MNLPNKLTLARLIMTPMFFIAFNLPLWFNSSFQNLSTILVLILFVLIEATDLLDGIIARKRNLVTDLGKVMDPFADTFARLTYFVCLMSVNIFSNYSVCNNIMERISAILYKILNDERG